MRACVQRLKPLGRKIGPRVYLAGVTPSATYGVEVFEPDETFAQVAMKGLCRFANIRSQGVSNTIIQLQFLPSILPEFGIRMTPLLRYHREIWTSKCVRHKQRGNLELRELVQLRSAIQKLDSKAKRLAGPQAPPRAVGASLALLDWSMVSWHVLRTHQGVLLDLTSISPACLKKLSAGRYQNILLSRCRESIRKREVWDSADA